MPNPEELQKFVAATQAKGVPNRDIIVFLEKQNIPYSYEGGQFSFSGGQPQTQAPTSPYQSGNENPIEGQGYTPQVPTVNAAGNVAPKNLPAEKNFTEEGAKMLDTVANTYRFGSPEVKQTIENKLLKSYGDEFGSQAIDIVKTRAAKLQEYQSMTPEEQKKADDHRNRATSWLGELDNAFANSNIGRVSPTDTKILHGITGALEGGWNMVTNSIEGLAKLPALASYLTPIGMVGGILKKGDTAFEDLSKTLQSKGGKGLENNHKYLTDVLDSGNAAYNYFGNTVENAIEASPLRSVTPNENTNSTAFGVGNGVAQLLPIMLTGGLGEAAPVAQKLIGFTTFFGSNMKEAKAAGLDDMDANLFSGGLAALQTVALEKFGGMKVMENMEARNLVNKATQATLKAVESGELGAVDFASQQGKQAVANKFISVLKGSVPLLKTALAQGADMAGITAGSNIAQLGYNETLGTGELGKGKFTNELIQPDGSLDWGKLAGASGESFLTGALTGGITHGIISTMGGAVQNTGLAPSIFSVIRESANNPKLFDNVVTGLHGAVETGLKAGRFSPETAQKGKEMIDRMARVALITKNLPPDTQGTLPYSIYKSISAGEDASNLITDHYKHIYDNARSQTEANTALQALPDDVKFAVIMRDLINGVKTDDKKVVTSPNGVDIVGIDKDGRPATVANGKSYMARVQEAIHKGEMFTYDDLNKEGLAIFEKENGRKPDFMQEQQPTEQPQAPVEAPQQPVEKVTFVIPKIENEKADNIYQRAMKPFVDNAELLSNAADAKAIIENPESTPEQVREAAQIHKAAVEKLSPILDKIENDDKIANTIEDFPDTETAHNKIIEDARNVLQISPEVAQRYSETQNVTGNAPENVITGVSAQEGNVPPQNVIPENIKSLADQDVTVLGVRGKLRVTDGEVVLETPNTKFVLTPDEYNTAKPTETITAELTDQSEFNTLADAHPDEVAAALQEVAPEAVQAFTDLEVPADVETALNKAESGEPLSTEEKSKVEEWGMDAVQHIKDSGLPEEYQSGVKAVVDGAMGDSWRAEFERAKATDDRKALNKLYTSVKIALNGVAQSRGEATVKQFEQLKSDIEEYANTIRTKKNETNTSETPISQPNAGTESKSNGETENNKRVVRRESKRSQRGNKQSANGGETETRKTTEGIESTTAGTGETSGGKSETQTDTGLAKTLAEAFNQAELLPRKAQVEKAKSGLVNEHFERIFVELNKQDPTRFKRDC